MTQFQVDPGMTYSRMRFMSRPGNNNVIVLVDGPASFPTSLIKAYVMNLKDPTEIQPIDHAGAGIIDGHINDAVLGNDGKLYLGQGYLKSDFQNYTGVISSWNLPY